MRTLPTALLTHYQSGATTIATCVRVVRRDGAVYGFTDHDRDVVVDGFTYSAVIGVDASTITTSSTMDVDNLEISTVLSAVGASAADIQAGVWNGAAVHVFEVNWRDTSMGVNDLKRASWGDVSHGRSGVTISAVGMMSRMQNNVGRTVLPTCDADFGDSRCGFNKAAVTVSSVVVTGVGSRSQFTASSLAHAAGYFDFGKITFNSGANSGLAKEIKLFQSGGIILLEESFPFAVSIGDVFSIEPGCGKRRNEDCRDRWGNVINFRGFHDLPGVDQMVRPNGI